MPVVDGKSDQERLIEWLKECNVDYYVKEVERDGITLGPEIFIDREIGSGSFLFTNEGEFHSFHVWWSTYYTV